MDDLTAQMCISLQLEDIAALTSARSALLPSDRIALQIQEAELKEYCTDRGLTDPPPTPIVRFRCEACGDRFTAGECVETPCHHKYCDVCLEELFSLSMRDRTLYPPRCCRQAIPWKDVRGVVSEDFRAKFEETREELNDHSPLYCHDRHCSNYIKADVLDPTKATCPTCHSSTCTLCKQSAHQGACPQDEEVQKMREYAKAEGNQECTRCHQLVELALGCNHITYVSSPNYNSLLHPKLTLAALDVFASTSSATAAVFNGRIVRARRGMRNVLLPELETLLTVRVWEELRPLHRLLNGCGESINFATRMVMVLFNGSTAVILSAKVVARHRLSSSFAVVLATRSCATAARRIALKQK